ncbi:MAG: bifunctional phosphoribosylaminoimidazolecarboxamide formyltransferase/inosine monophosphate cyclohydrolase [Salinisphaeraceae bacterium]|nr:bifunctional phosphoribosylaminoimidazolecarboxamide formyltransferase/inosine monophosphate cyclohydrolase [Salinisphaeraceae bacterium]
MSDPIRIRRALISVSDKTGLADLAQALAQFDVQVLSTGGTARQLRDTGLPVTDVAEHTGAPEIMGGRVKSLHPRIHGGILARRDMDQADLEAQAIDPIDLVVVNLYPFSQTIAQPGVSLPEAIEQIDIGGPAMLRAAAKNHRWVCVLTDPGDYAEFVAELKANAGAVGAEFRQRAALKGFRLTSAYDAAIADYLAAPDQPSEDDAPLPERLTLHFDKRDALRYGENPHQSAALYVPAGRPASALTGARQIQGKALSYNNLADADAALECVRLFDDAPTCVIVKHANPCGIAQGSTLREAYERAFATDPTSAFGGILAFNRPLDEETARCVLDNQFAEILLAPAVEPDCLPVLARKKNLRVLTLDDYDAPTLPGRQLKPIAGGLLVQDSDSVDLDEATLKTVSQRAPTDGELADLRFAWKVAKQVKSNAIVYVRDGQTIGIGAGQMSRVDSARIACDKAADAGLGVKGAAMASDAFFPFRDGIDTAAATGIASVIQPGGSIRDEEVIAAADEADMAMLFTGIRHFRH